LDLNCQSLQKQNGFRGGRLKKISQKIKLNEKKFLKFLNVGQGEPPVKEPTSYPTIKKIFGIGSRS